MVEPANMNQANLSKLRIQRDDDGEGGGGVFRMVAAGVAMLVLAAGAFAAWQYFLRPLPVVRVARATSPAAAGGAKSFDANGYLVPQKRAEVATKAAGVIDKVQVEEGDSVKAGDVLAVLRNNEETQQVEEARILVREAERQRDEEAEKRDEAKREFERKKKLHETKDVGDAELESAESTWKALDARVAGAETRLEAAGNRVKQAEIRLEDTNIRSPIDGVVTSRKVHPGEAASPAGIVTGTRGGALFTVADFSTLEAEVDVNESKVADLRANHAALLSVDAVPSKKYHGELRQVVPTADRQRAVVKVRVRIHDADKALYPELGVRVTFLGDEEAAAGGVALPTIPKEAVRRDGGTRVWVVADGKCASKNVELGAEKDGRVDVKSGLSGGELVVVGDVPVSEGMRVKPEER